VKMMVAKFVQDVVKLAVGVYHLNPRSILKLLLYVLLIICFTPTGFLFPTPLFAPKHMAVTVPTHESLDVMIYSLRRPRVVKPYSEMNDPNRNYLVRSWTDGDRLTRSDVSNGFHPPYPALVFVLDPSDVERLQDKHEDAEEKKLGELTFDQLEKIGELNSGKIDMWVVSPKNAEELDAFLREYCWYRHVSMVTFGSASQLVLKTVYSERKNNKFPTFLNGVLMKEPILNNDFSLSDEQLALAPSLPISIVGDYSAETETLLRRYFPESVSDKTNSPALEGVSLPEILNSLYPTWAKK